ncbi:MAG: lipopolysaccharide biosynthesis protein, partial [Vicinamibacterales bacterium]
EAQAPETKKPGLLRSATVYGTANVLERIIPVVLLPVLTYYLTAADAGMIAVFQAVAGMAAPLVGVNVSYSVRRRYFDEDRSRFPSYLAGCLWIIAGCTVIGLAFAVAGGRPLSRLSGLPTIWLAAAVIFAGFQELLAVPLTVWQVEHAARNYAFVQVGRAAGIAALTVLFVVAFGAGWRGFALATLIVTGSVAVSVAAAALLPRLNRHVTRASLFHALWYGASLIPHRLGALGARTADRFVIAYYVGPSETGLYWVAFQVGMAISVIADAFSRAWSPWLYAGLAERKSATDRRIVTMTYLYFAAIVGLGLLLALAAPAGIRLVLAPEFHDAGRFMGWLVAGFVFNAMYLGLSGIVFFAERTFLISWVTVVTTAIGIGLSLVLVPRVGAIGAAQASAIGLLLKFLLTWGLAQWARPLPWRLRA